MIPLENFLSNTHYLYRIPFHVQYSNRMIIIVMSFIYHYWVIWECGDVVFIRCDSIKEIKNIRDYSK